MLHPVCSAGPYNTNEWGLSSEGSCPCLICCQCCKELINGVGDRRKRNEGLMVKTIEWYPGELDSIPISAIELQCDAGQTFHRWLLIVSFSFPACTVGNTWGQIYRSAKHSNCNCIWLKRFPERNCCHKNLILQKIQITPLETNVCLTILVIISWRVNRVFVKKKR